MNTIYNLMALHNAASHAAVQYALLAQVSLRSERTLQAADDRDEAKEALRAALTEALAAQPVREPLSDDVIFKIACGTADEMWPDIGGVGWTKDDAKFYGIFCKKIEYTHGIGGDK